MCLVVFAVNVGLIWDSEAPDAEHIADVLQCIATTLQLSDVSLPLATTGARLVQTLGAYLYDFGTKKKSKCCKLTRFGMHCAFCLLNIDLFLFLYLKLRLSCYKFCYMS